MRLELNALQNGNSSTSWTLCFRWRRSDSSREFSISRPRTANGANTNVRLVTLFTSLLFALPNRFLSLPFSSPSSCPSKSIPFSSLLFPFLLPFQTASLLFRFTSFLFFVQIDSLIFASFRFSISLTMIFFIKQLTMFCLPMRTM